MGSMEHTIWFERTTGGASELRASQLARVSTSTLNRQLAKGELSPENVIALSRAYNVNPVQGLVATGYITSDEASGLDEDSLADSLSDRTLIRSLARRVDADADSWFAYGELEDGDGLEKSDDELARRRSNTTDDDVVPLGYVADSSPDEPEMGDDDYHDGP